MANGDDDEIIIGKQKPDGTMTGITKLCSMSESQATADFIDAAGLPATSPVVDFNSKLKAVIAS